MVSASTVAPVASIEVTRDIRSTTTRTRLTWVSSSRKSWAAAKKRAPSIR